MLADNVVIFDARPYHRAHQEPFVDIMKAVEALRVDQKLLVINTFDPKPLERVMEIRGFRHEAKQVGPDHWEVLFERDPVYRMGDPQVLDYRGSDPASVSGELLKVLANLAGHDMVILLFDRNPEVLCERVKKRGYQCETYRHPNGEYRVRAALKTDEGSSEH